MRIRTHKNRLNAGEVKPSLYGADGLAIHESGLQAALNGQPMSEGGMCERSGTIHVAACMDPGFASALYPFERSSQDVQMVELGATHARVFSATSRAGVADAVFAHGFPAEAVHRLRGPQLGDSLLLFDMNGQIAPRAIVRRADETWEAVAFTFRNGPFYELVDGVTLTLSNHGGAVTVTASSDVFTAGHIGAQLRLYHVSGGAPFNAWAADDRLGSSTGVYRYNNGRVYIAAGRDPKSDSGNDPFTGLNPPVHDDGTVSDGRTLWTFVDDGAGYGVISAVHGARSVTLDVREALPNMTQTGYWAFGGYCEAFGYPSAGALFEDRLFVAASPARNNELNASKTAGWTAVEANFKPGTGTGLIVDDDAVQRRLAGGKTHPITSLVTHGTLITFTTRSEFRVGGSADFRAVTPADASARERGGRGSAAGVEPVKTEAHILFATRGSRELRALDVADGGFSTSLSIASSHLFTAPIEDIAACSEPDRLVYVRLRNGRLLCHLFDPENEARGWAPYALGGAGKVCALAGCPGGSDRFDEAWIVVQRAGVHTIEVQGRRFRYEWDSEDSAVQMDNAAVYDGWNYDISANIAVQPGAMRGDSHSQTLASAGLLGDVAAGDTLLLRSGAGDGVARGFIVRARVAGLAGTALELEYETDVPDDFDALTSHWARGIDALEAGWLEGQVCGVLADGEDLGERLVSGAVTFDAPVGRVAIGLPFDWVIETLSADFGAAEGAGKAGSQRIAEVSVLLANSGAFSVYDPELPVARRQYEPFGQRNGAELLGQAPGLRSAPARLAVPAAYSEAGRVGFYGASPLPKEMLGVVLAVETHA